MNTLNQLKESVARLVVLVLVIEFLGVALSLLYAQPLDLLYLAVGILLVSGGLYLTTPTALIKTVDPKRSIRNARRNA